MTPRCQDCQHLRRPGRADGYCVARQDLPRAYGQNHPLRQLPEDRGRTCQQFALMTVD